MSCSLFNNRRLIVVNERSPEECDRANQFIKSRAPGAPPPGGEAPSEKITYERARQLCHRTGAKLYEPRVLRDQQLAAFPADEAPDGMTDGKSYWIGVQSVANGAVRGGGRVNRPDSKVLFEMSDWMSNESGATSRQKAQSVSRSPGADYTYALKTIGEELDGAVCEAFVQKEVGYPVGGAEPGGEMVVAMFFGEHGNDLARDLAGEQGLFKWPGEDNPARQQACADSLFGFVEREIMGGSSKREGDILGVLSLKQSYSFCIGSAYYGGLKTSNQITRVEYNALTVEVEQRSDRGGGLTTGVDMYTKPKMAIVMSLYVTRLQPDDLAVGFIYSRTPPEAEAIPALAAPQQGGDPTNPPTATVDPTKEGVTHAVKAHQTPEKPRNLQWELSVTAFLLVALAVFTQLNRVI